MARIAMTLSALGPIEAPCAFCGEPSWFTFECIRCGDNTAVCDACEDKSKEELCPDCLEVKAE